MRMVMQQVERKLFIGGRWTGGGEPIPVRNKYTGDVIGTIPTASRDDVDAAVTAAAAAAPGGAGPRAALPPHRGAPILQATANLIQARREEFARTIAAEAGKA